MRLDIQFVSSLVFVTSQRVSELQSSNNRPTPVRVFEVVNQISPADLYCYLHTRFGPPNGTHSFVRAPHSDNLIHWHWTLEHDQGLFDVQGTNFRTLFTVTGLTEEPSNPVGDLVSAFRSEFSKHRREMSGFREVLETWVEFVSPYQRLSRSIKQLMELLESTNADEVCEPSAPLDVTDPKLRESTIAQWESSAQILSKAYGISFGIRVMLPVMAEAFINLLLFCLMKEDIRSDDRRRQKVLRKPIELRVRSLHQICEGFARGVDYTHPACDDYRKLVKERNDLLHGNVSIEELEFNNLYFSENIPIFKTYRSMWRRAFDVQSEAVQLKELNRKLIVVQNFTDYVLSCLNDDIRANVEFVLSKFELGYNEKEDRVGVLFPDHLVDFRIPVG